MYMLMLLKVCILQYVFLMIKPLLKYCHASVLVALLQLGMRSFRCEHEVSCRRCC